jgi:arsenite methyltransferase
VNGTVQETTSGYLQVRHWLFRLRSALEHRLALLTGNTDWLLRKRFNRWAEWGVGEDMEQCHLKITRMALERMSLAPGDNVLEVGCGAGWASRLIARKLGEGSKILGIDIADEMVRRAQAKSAGIPNVSFRRGSAEHLPCPASSVNKLFSVEAFYYVKDQENALREFSRVLVPGGRLLLLIVFHKGNPESLHGVEELGMPLHYLDAKEYEAMLTKTGWQDVQTEIFEVKSRADGKADVHDRPLLIVARKPDTA